VRSGAGAGSPASAAATTIGVCPSLISQPEIPRSDKVGLPEWRSLTLVEIGSPNLLAA
jgi:hypothetical protein